MTPHEIVGMIVLFIGVFCCAIRAWFGVASCLMLLIYWK